MKRTEFATAAGAALLAALLFGASTPLAKVLLRDVSPVLLAGLLYLGSGIGLGLARTVRDRGWRLPRMSGLEWLWLALAIGFGGILGPLALMLGLAHTSAASASLLLNLEAVLTAVLAWVAFRENANRRIVIGMALIVVGAALLAWRGPVGGVHSGALLVAAACLCWALDNNFTRKVSANDALFLASAKGTIAGIVNTSIGLALGASLPGLPVLGETLVVGLLSYGVSLVLFVLALRGGGAARTGADFSTAPFCGAKIAFLAFGTHPTPAFWAAAALMAIGVWLHLTEPHPSGNPADVIAHSRPHVHGAAHQHTHDFAWDGSEPHAHHHVHR